MVTRETFVGLCAGSGYALGEDQAITAAEALQLYTISNAQIMSAEKNRGSIEPGKLADLTILSKDIVNVPSEEIRNTKALLTMVGDKEVYRDGM